MDDNLPPQLAEDPSFLNSSPLMKTCPDCKGDGYIVEMGQTIGCCGIPVPLGECCGNGIPVQTPEQRQCHTCGCSGEVEMSYDEVVHYLEAKKEPKDL